MLTQDDWGRRMAADTIWFDTPDLVGDVIDNPKTDMGVESVIDAIRTEGYEAREDRRALYEARCAAWRAFFAELGGDEEAGQ